MAVGHPGLSSGCRDQLGPNFPWSSWRVFWITRFRTRSPTWNPEASPFCGVLPGFAASRPRCGFEPFIVFPLSGPALSKVECHSYWTTPGPNSRCPLCEGSSKFWSALSRQYPHISSSFWSTTPRAFSGVLRFLGACWWWGIPKLSLCDRGRVRFS